MSKLYLDSQIVLVSKYGILPGYGMNSRIFNVAKKLSEHYSVTLITSDSNHLAIYPKTNKIYNFNNYDKLNTIWIKTLKYKTSRSLKRLLTWLDFEIKLSRIKVIKNKEPKLIIVSSLSLITVLWALRIKRKYGVKFVFEIRDFYPLSLTAEFGISRFNPVVLALAHIERQGLIKSDLIVGTMPLIDDYVFDIVKVRRPTFYSPNGLSIYASSLLQNKDEMDKSVLEFKENFQTIVIYSGSIGHSNNLDPLIEVILNSTSLNLTTFGFIIIGDGDLKKAYQEKLINQNNAIFIGRIPSERVYKYLELSDILYLSVKPSVRFTYGHSLNKVLDYLYVGKPVVATYNGFPNILSEIEGYKITGEDIVDIAKAFYEVAQYDTSILEKIKISARSLLELKFTYEVITQNYLNAISSLIE
jgi:glycosyltransferase involved in cell wall biosynthesis